MLEVIRNLDYEKIADALRPYYGFNLESSVILGVTIATHVIKPNDYFKNSTTFLKDLVANLIELKIVEACHHDYEVWFTVIVK